MIQIDLGLQQKLRLQLQVMEVMDAREQYIKTQYISKEAIEE